MTLANITYKSLPSSSLKPFSPTLISPPTAALLPKVAFSCRVFLWFWPACQVAADFLLDI